MTSTATHSRAATPAAQPTWHVERARGVVAIRRQGAAVPEPHDWIAPLADLLHTVGGAHLIGAKRLDHAGRLFSMGDMLLHPKGFHHLGRGLPAGAYRFPEEADAVSGGVCIADPHAFDGAAGDAPLTGELALINLCLAIRRRGGRCLVAPQAVVVDDHTPLPTPAESADFADRWGFDWRAADLDEARRKWAGTGLLWAPRYHAQAMPFDKYVERGPMHWTSYDNVPAYRQRADHLVKLAAAAAAGGTLIDLGCGDGLFTHLIASAGVTAIGIDPEPAAIQQARQMTSTRAYPAAAPDFRLGSGDALELPDASVHAAAMLDVIEHLPNPVAVLRHVDRVLRPGGRFLVSTPSWQYGGWSDPLYHVCEYTMDELVAQIQSATSLRVLNTGMIKGIYRDLIVVAGKPN